jgi:hypothetical protein
MKVLKNIAREAIGKGADCNLEIGFCFGLFGLFQRSESCKNNVDESTATGAVKIAFYCECSQPIAASVKTDLVCG